MKIKFYKVGGAVRDLVMGLQPKDIDFAVEAPSFAAMRAEILALGGQIFLETEKMFTIRAKVPDLGACDYVLCRKDGEYTDGRSPDSVTVGTIFDDLARRDFTMNAMAIDITDTGGLVDPFGGRADICARVIRCVGNPLSRFAEDKLRIFRAVRFAVCKEMAIEQQTSNAMFQLGHDLNDGFNAVSTERIREELFKMFSHDSYASFNLLFEVFGGLGEIVRSRGIWFKPTIGGK
jgi:tRNA nucleotidyltransferase/poly(A) polymerase